MLLAMLSPPTASLSRPSSMESRLIIVRLTTPQDTTRETTILTSKNTPSTTKPQLTMSMMLLIMTTILSVPSTFLTATTVMTNSTPNTQSPVASATIVTASARCSQEINANSRVTTNTVAAKSTNTMIETACRTTTL